MELDSVMPIRERERGEGEEEEGKEGGREKGEGGREEKRERDNERRVQGGMSALEVCGRLSEGSHQYTTL